MPANTEQLRCMNMQTLRGILKEGPGTKAEIARRSGLSYATCNTVLNELLESGEALALEQALGTGGRPATVYSYNGNFGSILCLYVSMDGGKILVTHAVYNFLGEEVEAGRSPLVAHTVEGVLCVVGELLATRRNIRAIALGVPGMVTGCRTVQMCDFVPLANQPMAERIEARFHLPATVENDMNLTVLGFEAAHPSKGAGSAALLFPKGTGTGCGLLLGGRLIRGATHFAGELDYLPGGTAKEVDVADESEDATLQLAVHTLRSIVALVNPAQVLLSGGRMSEEMVSHIRLHCAQALPPEHLPRFVYAPDIRPYYLRGLLAMAEETLACPVELVERQL